MVGHRPGRYDSQRVVHDSRRPSLIAVIDDDEMSRRAIGRLLQLGGFDAALFDSAETFIMSPPERAPLCLIVDVHLTGMSGIDLQRKLHADGSHVPVVITTGDRSHVVRDQSLEAGCLAFLWKPFSADMILTLLASIDPPAAT